MHSLKYLKFLSDSFKNRQKGESSIHKSCFDEKRVFFYYYLLF